MYIFLFCSANALITDLPDFIPLIEMNITENKSLIKGSAKALPLRWGEDTVQDYFHYILLADCIYYEEVPFFSFDDVEVHYKNYFKKRSDKCTQVYAAHLKL